MSNKSLYFKFQRGLLILLGGYLLMLVGTPTANAQTNPDPTPDPTVQALENSVERQAQEIVFLNERLAITNEKLETRFWIAMVAAGVFGIAGSVGFIQMERGHRKKMEELEDKFKQREDTLWKEFSQKMQSKFEKELYGLDATMWTIRIREGETRERLERRLQLSGFRNISVYNDLDKRMLKGITIVPITNDEQVAEFNKFLEFYVEKLYPEEAAFVIYTDGKQIAGIAIDAFENLAFANTPTTLATNILAVGRGLRR